MMLVAGLLVLAATPLAVANNIAVTNVALVNQDTDASTVDVQFDLSWDNSWRTVPNASYPAYTNWDAAWVFVKFQAPGSNKWEHARLSSVSGTHTPAAGSAIDAVPDGVGVFVHRSSPGTGDVSYASTKLRWTYGANGYSFAKGASVKVSVHAIEMAYVPQGAFYVGNSGGVINNSFREQAVANNPIPIPDDNAITLYYGAGPTSAAVPAAFPNGHDAFYCMKYETSQGQYADFLNKLTAAQDATRYVSGEYGNSMYSITGSYPNRYADFPNHACNFINWSAGCAYAAWAGLRPMTELEFEKACRGPATAVANEHAWGSTALTYINSELGPEGTCTAFPSTANGNINVVGFGMTGPTRVGIYATATSTRAQAGASYWGIMELSGNLWEKAATVGTANGLAFTGSTGSGTLNSSGNATNADWYAADMAGGGERGGAWNEPATAARVADRDKGATANNNNSRYRGWRAVRQAP
jgi:hypothetical protein